MPTPLFPEDGLHIRIEQGSTGDCYLLATLDCLLNGLSENRQYLKSLFLQNDDGSIEIKLQHSQLSGYLQTEAFAAKGYGYRKEDKHDVFIITPHAIERIDNDLQGVKTNCLAIKLLEHILPYYYAHQRLGKHVINSIFAHNEPGRHDAETSSTQFMGKLLGFYITDKSDIDIDEIIHQKHAHPEKPIYISMSYGKKDIFGRYHGRHALKIKQIVPHATISGEYHFILSNPHNNAVNEEYLSSDIHKRSPRFSLMDLQPSPSPSPFAQLLNLPTAPPLMAKKMPIMPPIAEEINFLKQENELTVRQINTMLESAINEKMTRRMQPDQARAYIAMSLFCFSLDNNFGRITSAGGLRKHFQDNPTENSLKFLKQIDLSENNLNQQIIDVIIDAYAIKKGLDKTQAQKAVLTMLEAYRDLKDINAITRTANLRQFISEGILSVETLLKAFPKVAKDQLPNKKAYPILQGNNPFEFVVANNGLELFKEKVREMDKRLILCANMNCSHRDKEYNYLSQLSNAHSFVEIKEIVERAMKDLASGPTYKDLNDILNAVTISNTMGQALSIMAIAEVKKPEYEHLSEAIKQIANSKIHDVFLDIDTSIKEGWYLAAVSQATNYEQIKTLTQLANAEVKSEFVHYKVGELIEKISQSENMEELISNLNNPASLRF